MGDNLKINMAFVVFVLVEPDVYTSSVLFSLSGYKYQMGFSVS